MSVASSFSPSEIFVDSTGDGLELGETKASNTPPPKKSSPSSTETQPHLPINHDINSEPLAEVTQQSPSQYSDSSKENSVPYVQSPNNKRLKLMVSDVATKSHPEGMRKNDLLARLSSSSSSVSQSSQGDMVRSNQSSRIGRLASQNSQPHRISHERIHSRPPPGPKASSNIPRSSLSAHPIGSGSGVPLRLSRIESDQSQRLFKLHHVIDQQREEIQSLSTSIMTLQTQKSSQEFEYYKQQDLVNKLKVEQQRVEDEIEELKEHEQTSLKEIGNKYEEQTQSLKLAHEQKLRNLKAKVSKQIEAFILESEKRNENEIKSAQATVRDIESQIKFNEQDLNRKLIKLKEDHNMKLISLDKSMDESLKGLQEELERIDKIEVIRKEEIAGLENSLKETIEPTLQRESLKMKEVKIKAGNKEREIQGLHDEIRQLENHIREVETSFTNNEAEIKRLERQENEFKEKYDAKELERRSLHNRLQELKGNIRVFCRIRPPPPPPAVSRPTSASTSRPTSKSSRAAPPIDLTQCASFDISENLYAPDCKTELKIDSRASDLSIGNNNRIGLSPKKSSHRFFFDHVIPQSETNEQIFVELSQLIQSSMDGFNVCVFAYGQTGSGKTWTMSNPGNGMIPLSINKIFQDIEDLKSGGWEYQLEGQFLEIYNETIVDLLGISGSAANGKHEIKHDDVNGTTTVTNVTTMPLNSTEQVNHILKMASKKRSTAATKSNERSSRSHSIFIIKIQGRNDKRGVSTRGTLNLIDLAGSERISNSQVTGDRLKETQAINKSLSSLGDVIYALGQEQNSQKQDSHIPYRNSKLTYLLKNSLGGNSKTLMFVNISPLQKDFNESLNSLRFATKVNGTKLGRKSG